MGEWKSQFIWCIIFEIEYSKFYNLFKLWRCKFPKFDLKTEGSSIPWAGSKDYTDINDKDDKANKN